MRYHGGPCSPILYAHHLSAPLDSASSYRLSRLVSDFEYTPRGDAGAIRVLVAGDHACLRASLKTMLELDPRIRVVGEASDDCEAVKMSRKLRPDVVLIDLDMRCCDSFDALAEITQRKLASSIVALSIHEDQAQRLEAKAAGVNLFLEKGVPYKQLINAIRLAASSVSSTTASTAAPSRP